MTETPPPPTGPEVKAAWDEELKRQVYDILWTTGVKACNVPLYLFGAPRHGPEKPGKSITIDLGEALEKAMGLVVLLPTRAVLDGEMHKVVGQKITSLIGTPGLNTLLPWTKSVRSTPPLLLTPVP